MYKKGISPLIATVLVIGFTIVLAAMVMKWGGDLFKTTQEQTAVSSELKIACSTELTELTIKSFSDGVIVLDNKNERDIQELVFRLYDESGVLTATKATDGTGDSAVTSNSPRTDPKDPVLSSFLVVTFTVGEASKIEILPKIKLQNGEVKTCSTSIIANA